MKKFDFDIDGKSWADVAEEEEREEKAAAAAKAAAGKDSEKTDEASELASELKGVSVEEKKGTGEAKEEEKTSDEATADSGAAKGKKGDKNVPIVPEMTDEEKAKKEEVKKNSLKPFKKMSVEVQRADPESPLHSVTSFADLGLPKELLDGVLLGMKFDKPSKIQEAALPIILGQKPENLIGQAQSGTGKTAAFVLCMLFRVDPSIPATQSVCLCHTRELAEQTFQVVRKMGQYTKISVRLLIGGDGDRSKDKIHDHILICTPGRLSDCVQRHRTVDLKSVKCFVLDEADHMLEMQNHKETSLRIKRFLPKTCQFLLFSATFKDELMQFAQKMIPQPNIIRLKTEQVSLDNIKQYMLSAADKFGALCDIYDLLELGQSIIFVEKRETADDLNAKMNQAGHKTSVIHGKVENRFDVMKQFRDGESRVLISTRLLARGIDVEQVTLVVLYDVPLNFEVRPPQPAYDDYIHMIGRSGRFGKYGISVAIVDNQRDYQNFKSIEQYYGKPIADLSVDDIESLQDVIKATI